jgi:hypothetical protein
MRPFNAAATQAHAMRLYCFNLYINFGISLSVIGIRHRG